MSLSQAMVTDGTGLESPCEKPASAGLTDYTLMLPMAALGVGPAPHIASHRRHLEGSGGDTSLTVVPAMCTLRSLSLCFPGPRGSVVPTAIKARFCQSAEQLRLAGLQGAVLLSEKGPLLQPVSRP